MSRTSDNDNPFSAPDTGHTWDGNLRELTNPPPRWWIIGFHASWIFVVIYGLLYPMWPLVNSHTKGFLGWSSIQEYREDLADLERVRGPFEARLAALGTEEIAADPELRQYAVASARVLFADKCGACHGAGGQGNPGYPVLADDDWLFGGTLAQIEASITQGRKPIMPAHSGTLTDAEIADLARHSVALSQGSEHAAGKALYLAKGCAGCHGIDAKGNPLLGAPNLTDRIWRFVGPDQEAEARATIAHGVNMPGNPKTRSAEMPAFQGKLAPADIRRLTLYVHQLGGGR